MVGATSEMDVSRVDPEEVLVDFENVELGDISVEIDESFLNESGDEDKVLVSIRYGRSRRKYSVKVNNLLTE